MIGHPRHPGPVEPRREAAGAVPVRGGFSLVELLVVMSIMVVLLGLVSAAVSGARASQKKQSTRLLISKLDAIIQQQYLTYSSRSIQSVRSPAGRSAALRRIVSADMPDNWEDVRLMTLGMTVLSSGTVAYTTSSGSAVRFPLSPSQRAYAGVLTGLARRKNGGAANQSQIDATAAALGQNYGDAECLFMIVMYGGFADCVECGALKSVKKGDDDSDGAFEFWDEWNRPIRYILWPAKLELPPGTPFFATTANDIPFLSTSGGRVMRPLVFSGGSDTVNSTAVNTGGNLVSGSNCGVPSPVSGTPLMFGSLELTGGIDGRADNITNFDAEVRK